MLVYLCLSPAFLNKGSSIEKPMISHIIQKGTIKNTLLSGAFLLSLIGSITAYAEIIVENRLKKSFNNAFFVLPDAEELHKVQIAYQKELADQPSNELWKALFIQRVNQDGFLFLLESKKNYRGRGLFVLRKKPVFQPWLLQAPHAQSDLYTGKIVSLMFLEAEFKSAMWNSVPRKTPVQNSMLTMSADMAHLPNSYWQAITESFARYYKKGKIIQIHGFSKMKRKSVAAKNSDVIISAGHRSPPFWVQEYAQCLKKALPVKVSLYPYDVKELGATTNVQGHLLQHLGFNGFLHIELSKAMRKQLLNNKKTRKLLSICLNSGNAGDL